MGSNPTLSVPTSDSSLHIPAYSSFLRSLNLSIKHEGLVGGFVGGKPVFLDSTCLYVLIVVCIGSAMSSPSPYFYVPR